MKKMILAAAAFATMIGIASTGAMADDAGMKILGEAPAAATASQAITAEPAPAPASAATAATAPMQAELATLQSQVVQPTVFQSFKNKISNIYDYFFTPN
jgi:hypothetical protein